MATLAMGVATLSAVTLPRPQGGSVGDLVAKLHMSVTKLANTFRDMRKNENANTKKRKQIN